jgi:S-DNA-T family DNA segregation ATPase FtsK/SpoIIIE
MPHLLIAGATGTGKSVAINSLLSRCLYRNTPQDVKFILVDPKRVELNLYNGIPHLLTPSITESDKAVNALKWAVAEMDRRYKVLSEVGKRNIGEYNEST